MKSITTELAETLFIDMVNGNAKLSMNEVEEMAISSLQYATMFFSKVQDSIEKTDVPVTYKMKGCKKCFGSGGKLDNPCRVCRGSGKVKA